MIDNTLLKDKTIIIANNNHKIELLKYISNNMPIIDIKIMTKKELESDLYFAYSNDILDYVSKKINKNIDVCKSIIDNLYYSDSNNILEDLKENKKIYNYDTIIKKYKNLVVYDMVLDDILLNKIKETNKDIIIVDCKSEINKENVSYVYESNDLEGEVLFLFDNVLRLLNENVDVNNIKIYIPDDEYLTCILDYSRMFNIKVNTNKKISLYSYEITKNILKRYKSGEPIDSIISSIKENNEIIEKLVSVINKYDYNNDIYEILKYEFKHNYISQEKYTNALEIVDIDDVVINNSTYLFILGFNQTFIPRIKKDDDYLKDEEKIKIGLMTSTQKNIEEKKHIKHIINKSKETYISYKLKTPFNKYIKSSFLDELDLIKIDHKHDYKVSPSREFDKYSSSKMIDDIYKLGIRNDGIDALLPNIDNDYDSYDNSYELLNSNTINKLLKDELKLSYTSINSFYECKFKYYLKYLLKVKENNSNLNSLFLGNLFHYVLSKIFIDNKDIDTLINEYLNQEGCVLSNKEQIYLNKYKVMLNELIEIINDNKKRSSFKDLYYEKELEIEKINKIKIKLVGKIDKILSFDDGTNTYIIVIDYKTGELKQEYNNIVYGLNMQLFMYAYLIDKTSIVKNAKVSGFYLQPISHELIKKEEKKDIKGQLKELYRLSGYTKENQDIVFKIDNDLSSLKNIGINKDGTFSSRSLTFNDAIYDKFVGIVDEKINNAISDIVHGDYKINPKEIDDENISCKYCKYFDICFKKYRDIEHLNKQKLEDYKAGDNNA